MVSGDSTTRLAPDLLQQCQALLAEVESFQNFLFEQKAEKGVEIRHFRNHLTTECKSLQKVCSNRNSFSSYARELTPAFQLVELDPKAPRTVHNLRSSNLPFYSAVWNAAKNSSGVVALEKRFYWPSSQSQRKENDDGKPQKARQKQFSALVDVVSQNGSEWIKVSSMTEKRIFFDLAKAGWAGDSSSEDERSEDDDDEPEGIMKQAEALFKASRATRVRYHHPHVRFVLPKITRGRSKEVDQILEKVTALGIKVETSEDVHEAPHIAKVLHSMAVNPFHSFSDTLNVDCTVLLALISDLSHSCVSPEDWHHRFLRRQIEMEKEEQLLPNSLWPACGSRPLVCSQEAATRMNEIVNLVGSVSEKKRRDYLMETQETANWSREQRVKGFQELSAYEVPLHWNLPIVVVDAALSTQKHLPPIAYKVMERHSAINKSVFLYGWAAGMTTISSNRAVAKEIEAAVEAYREGTEDVGPHIWLCQAARSLVGKEKTRRNCDA